VTDVDLVPSVTYCDRWICRIQAHASKRSTSCSGIAATCGYDCRDGRAPPCRRRPPCIRSRCRRTLRGQRRSAIRPGEARRGPGPVCRRTRRAHVHASEFSLPRLDPPRGARTRGAASVDGGRPAGGNRADARRPSARTKGARACAGAPDRRTPTIETDPAAFPCERAQSARLCIGGCAQARGHVLRGSIAPTGRTGRQPPAPFVRYGTLDPGPSREGRRRRHWGRGRGGLVPRLRWLRDINDEDQRRHIRELAYMRCPDCGAPLKRAPHYGVTIEECPLGHGMWLTDAEMHTLAKRERNSWIGRYFFRPKARW